MSELIQQHRSIEFSVNLCIRSVLLSVIHTLVAHTWMKITEVFINLPIDSICCSIKLDSSRTSKAPFNGHYKDPGLKGEVRTTTHLVLFW